MHTPGGKAAPLLFLASLLVLSSLLAPRANASIYWTSDGSPGAIARAELDGTGRIEGFIPNTYYPAGVAVDAKYIYWGSQGGVDSASNGAIGRAHIDGTGVNQTFITGAHPGSVAVDAGHIYWINYATNAISRANLDGTGVEQSFIPGPADPWSLSGGLAVDAEHLYWTNRGFPMHTIGRADLNGSGVDQTFITGLDYLYRLAVGAAHIYWTSQGGPGDWAPEGAVGRANLDGTGVEPSFIAGLDFGGIAVDVSHLYWTDLDQGTIARANLDGTGIEQSFIRGVRPWAIAVDGLDTRPPETRITKGAPNRTEKNSVKFKFSSDEQGSSFQCKLDKGKWKACRSPKKYKGLKRGKHKFQVGATDAAGNVDPTPAKDKFKVVD